MQVAGVGLVPVLALDQPPEEREHDVEDRDAEDHHRDQRGARRRSTCCPENAKSVRPPIVIVGTASSTPRKSAPASPMMIFAGFQLNGRNPTQTPTAMIATSGAMLSPLEEAGLEQPVGEQEQRGAGDRDDARGQTVEAVDEVDRVREQHDPQRGDERREVGREHDHTVWNRLNGMRKKNITTPNTDSRLAASTCPASFAGGDTSMRSSSAPMREHHARAEHQADRLGVVDEHLVELVHLRRDGHRGEEADEHRRAAERRRRAPCARGARRTTARRPRRSRIASRIDDRRARERRDRTRPRRRPRSPLTSRRPLTARAPGTA